VPASIDWAEIVSPLRTLRTVVVVQTF